MHFGVAQRFAALIAGVRQMSLKLSAKAAAGLPRSVRGYAGLWRGIASQGQGDTDLWRGMVSERGVVSCYVPSAARSFAFGELAHIEALVFCVRAYGRVKEICFRGTGAHQGACSFVARDGLGTWGVRAMYRAPRVHLLSGSWRTSRRLRFASKQRACRTSGQCRGIASQCQGVCRFVTSDCMTKCRDYEFRVFDPSALFTKKSQKNC